jgi:hypothetical protein
MTPFNRLRWVIPIHTYIVMPRHALFFLFLLQRHTTSCSHSGVHDQSHLLGIDPCLLGHKAVYSVQSTDVSEEHVASIFRVEE